MVCVGVIIQQDGVLLRADSVAEDGAAEAADLAAAARRGVGERG